MLLHHPKKGCFKTAVTPFSRSGWSVVRSASLAKGGTSRKRPSTHLHKVPTRSNKASPRTLQMALADGMEFQRDLGESDRGLFEGTANALICM
jgi:hypothetical protein